jgi:hypothetical protein
MQKGIVFHKGQRYLKLLKDGYIYPYSETLAKNTKKFVEYFPFEAESPIEIVQAAVEEDGLLEKLNDMTKRQINKFAKLEKTDREIQLTGKPAMVEQAMKKLTWR